MGAGKVFKINRVDAVILLIGFITVASSCQSVTSEADVSAQEFNPIKIGILPDTQGSGAMVSTICLIAWIQRPTQ